LSKPLRFFENNSVSINRDFVVGTVLSENQAQKWHWIGNKINYPSGLQLLKFFLIYTQTRKGTSLAKITTPKLINIEKNA